jgi:hypothetical protein
VKSEQRHCAFMARAKKIEKEKAKYVIEKKEK